MKKTLQKSSLFIIGMLISLFAFSQTPPILNFQSIPSGPYGKGSSIAVLFKPEGVIPRGSTFNLYLSESNGTFQSGKAAIGTVNSHYTTYINGIIPVNSIAGSNYKLKVEIVIPNAPIVSQEIQNFTITIQDNSGSNGDINGDFLVPTDITGASSLYLKDNTLKYYGFSNCLPQTTRNIYLFNKTGLNINWTSKNEFDFTNITPGPSFAVDPFAQNGTLNANGNVLITQNLKKVHYRFFQQATDPSQANTISTKAFYFINNQLSAPFSVVSNTICYEPTQAGAFSFKVDIDSTREGSAFFNFPAVSYTSRWDDGTANEVNSIRTIIFQNGLLNHNYSKSSCGEKVDRGVGQITYNSFGPSMTATHITGCTTAPVEVITPVQIFPKPKLDFTAPVKSCLGTSVTFTNTSNLGLQGSTTADGCTEPNISFEWFVDGVKVASTRNLTISNLSVGTHSIVLSPVIGAGIALTCEPEAIAKNICIESIPPNTAKFALISNDNIRYADTSFCPSNNSFTVINQSGTLSASNFCSPLSYNWKLTGPAGFSQITSNVTSSNPNFTVPSLIISGNYTLTLTISNPCGTSNAYTRIITVLEPPSITTQPVNRTICEGDNTSFTTVARGSNLNYRWQISTDNGANFTDISNGGVYTGTTTASLNITGATFSMNGYKYKLIISGSCPNDVTSNIVTLTVNQRPTSVISGSTTVCANTPAIISIALTGTAPWKFTYSDGTITSPLITTSSSTYTFSVSLASNKTYTVTSLLDANCNAIPDDRTGSAVITVNPLPTISGTLNACVGKTTQLTGTATADATTPWSSASTGVATIDNTGLVTGVSAGTSVITYTNSNGCKTTREVTINPLPTVSIPNTPQSLCKSTGSPSGTVIIPTSITTTITGYQWFSNPTASTSGGTAVSTSSTFTPPNTTTGELYYYLTVTNNNGCVATSNVSGSIKVYGQPTITPLPITTSYCINTTAATLTPTITNGGYGTLSYQWYSNSTSSFSGAQTITNETNASYTPPTNVAGIKYYFVVVTNGGPSSASNCNTNTSTITEVKVYATPTIPNDPVSASYCIGATPVAALSIPGALNGGYGTTTYQWYSNTTASTTGGILIGSAATYTPNISSAGTTYYYANLSNGGTGGALSCNNVNSGIASITVHPLPVITSPTFASESLCISSTATSMTVSATTATGTIASYQWFSNTNANNTGGTRIDGATNATFTPPTNATGTTYYYCEVINSWGCKATTAVSGAIKVYSAATISTQPIAADYCISASVQATELNVTAATNAPGSLTYQWYSNTSNSNTGGNLISTATNATYRPVITSAGATYYYVEVGNGGPSGCAITKSNATLINVFSKPTIITNLVSSNYCKDASANALSVSASSIVGTLTYEWYENPNGITPSGTIINGANSATYTPSTSNVGTKYYYVVIKNGGPANTCNTITSDIATINVFTTPTITSHPVSTTYCKDNIVTPLTVGGATTGGLGTLSYQWFSNTTNTNSGGTTITNTTSTFTPSSTTPGTYYYYVEVRNGATGGATACNTRPSDVATIIIHPLPVSTSTFASQNVCLGTNATSMTASATTATGTIATYQWYKNSTNSYTGATQIATEINATFTPPTSTPGTTYYFCEITNSWGCSTRTAISGAINVYAAPVITSQPTGATYCQNVTANALSVTATAGGLGTPTYQWYSNTTNSNSGGTLLTGATSATYSPSTTIVGTTYYYVEINNGGGAAGCSILASNTAAIVVNDLPVINSITNDPQTLCLNSIPSNLSVTASTATGTISATGYQWYSNTTNSPSGAILITGANTSTYAPPTNVVGTTYYFAVITNSFNCTTTTPVSGAIKVNPLPTITTHPSISSQSPKCLNEVFSALSVSASAGSGSILKYEWYSNTTNSTSGGTLVATNTTTSTTNTYTPPSSSPGVLYYYVIVYNTNNCQFTSNVSAPFTVNDLPSISVQPSTSNQTACLNTATTGLTVNASPGVNGNISSYTWYRTSNLSATPVVWTTVATNTTSSTTNTYTPASNTVGTLYYRVLVTNSYACSKYSEASGSVTINPVAIIPNQDDKYCSGTPFSKTLTSGTNITVPANTTYSWNTPVVTGGITGGAPGTAQPTINGTLTNPTNTPQTATYTVTPRTGTCDGATFTYTVTINPKATITVPDLNSCSGLAFTFTPEHGTNGIIPANTTYAWSIPSVTGGVTGGVAASNRISLGGNLTNPTNAQQKATYTLTPTSPGGPCIGSDFTIVVNVNARPVIANKTQPICSGTAFSITPVNTLPDIVPANTTYSWTVIDNPFVTGDTDGSTNGNTISQTLTNNSNEVRTVVYTVTPVSGDAGNCTGPTFTITVTVNPRPRISAKTVPACSNANFTTTITNAVDNDIVPLGTTYTWSLPIVTGGMTGGATGTGATSVSGNLINPTSVEQTATYTVSPSFISTAPGSTSCTGPDFTVVATIKPKVNIVTPPTASACSNDLFTFSLTNGAGGNVIPIGTTYTWTSVPTVTGGLTGGATGSNLNTIGGTLVNPSNTSQTATYKVTANSNNCFSAEFFATATIFARPFVKTIDASTCSGTPFSVLISNGGGNILPTGTTYTWTVAQINNVSGAFDVTVPTSNISQTLTNNTNTDKTVIYTVRPISGTDGNCVGDPFTVNITVKPKPAVTETQEISICSGDEFINEPLNGNGNIIPVGTRYAWTTPVSNPVGAVSGGLPQASPQTQVRQVLTNNTNKPATLTYTVTPSANGCSGSSYPLTINVNPKPNITTSPETICSGQTFTVIPVNVTNGIVPVNSKYTWEVADNPNVTGESNVTTAVSFISQTLINTSNSMQTVTYTVRPKSGDAGTCLGNPFTLIVYVNPQPNITSIPPQTICSGNSFFITPVNLTNGIVPSNTRYTWGNPNDNPIGSITGQSAQLVAVPPSISQPLNNITNTPATITYTITPIAGACTGPDFTAVITVNPKPAITAPPETICSEGTFTVLPIDGINGIVPNPTTYTWNIPVSNPAGAITGWSTQTTAANNISQKLTNTTNAAATLTYWVIPRSGAAGNCQGDPFNVVVNVNAKPVIGNQNLAPICSGQTFNVPLTNGGSTIIPSNTTYTWVVSTNSPDISGQSDVSTDQQFITQTLTNNTNVVRQITYRVTPKSGATGNCVGAPFFVTVTVNPKPSVTTLPETICSENSFSIEPVNITNGIVPANTSYTWTTPTSNPASAISGGIAQSSPVFKISQLLTNNSNFRGTLTYRVTPTSGAAGACIGDPFNVEVTVNPKPVLTSTLTPNAICNERNFFYNPTSPTEGRSWVWTRNVVAGITNTQATGTGDINETLINTTPNRITVPYTFALTSFGCPNTQTVNVIVNPTPKLTSPLILAVRCSGEPVNYTPNSGTIGTTYTWTRANIAGISNPAANGIGAISETLINTSPNPIIVNYEYTLTANACNNTQIVSVTIDPLPIANFNIGGVRADCGPITRTFINNSSVNSSPLTNGTFTWGIGVIKNGANIPVFSNVNTDYTTQVTYTFTNNKGIRDSLYPIFLTAKSPNGCLNTYRDTITVRPDANIDLTINSEAACAPFNAINSINVVNKIDPSPNPTINLLSSYKWTIRDRNGVVVSNTVSPNPPNFNITNPDDTLYLALKVNSIYGCKPDSVNRKVFTYKNPIVNFSVAPQNSCTLLETQAINNSYIGTNTNRTTSPLLYEWYANNSLISRAAGPVNFKLPNNSNTIDANYTIKLVVTENINNCKDSSSIGNLIVYPKPKAIFTIDKGDTTCTTVNGVNSSVSNSSLFKTGTIPQYRWSVTKTNLLDTARAIIIDSTTSPFIAARPNFQFKDAQGTIDTSYNINMMVTTIDGCKDTLTRKIVIARRPKVEFSIPQEACGIFNLAPVDNTINIPNDSLNRQWSVLPAGGLSILNATTFNPTINFPVNRTASSIAYEVKQAVASKIGCLDDLKKIITIHPKPTASFIVGKTDSCGPWTKTFINTSDAKNGLGINGITSRWEIKLNNRIELNTNTRNLTYTFTNTGVVDNVYTVTLFVSNPQECSDTTAIQEITVHPNARAFFNDNTKGCAPFRIRDYIKVQDFPEANDIWRYEWRIFDRFGFLLANYDSSVLAPDYVIENESDTVTLQLIAYSKWNCTQDIFSRKIITYPNSVHANAESASTICSGLPLVFKNKSYYGNNFQTDNLQYQWFVNDVKVSTETNPTFTFNNSSNIVDSIVNVKLLVTYTNTGCDQTWSKDITVFPAPLAKFSVANVEICGNPSGFKNYITESIIAKNNVYSPVWTITNLTTSKPAALNILPTSTNKEYQLQLGDNNGNIDTVYAVNLSVTSINGCKSDATTNISLYRRPDVKFSISNTLVCGESTLQITDQTTNVPTSKVWSYTTPTGGPLTFFPSATATNPKVLVPPNITGNLVTYYIKQNATTVNGCTESFTIQLDAKALPTAKFSMSETSSCLETATIKFTDESVPRTPETIIGWAWDFGDGSTSNVKNPSHNFSKPGTYTISLVITNNEGCSSLPTSKTVIVYGSPKADFVMPKQICLNDIISFVNTSSLGYGNTKFISNTWDFGDGSPLDYSVNPSHTFKSSGTYKVSLSVRADNSCVTSTFTADVIVIGYPTANFSVTNYCVESPILFKDLSTPGYGDKLGAWKWDFGDKAFSNLTNPTHIYKSTGTFPVNLIVSGSLCPSLESTITIPLKIIDRRKDSVYAIKYLQYNIAQTLCAVPGGDKYSWFPSTDINPINSRCVTINVQHPKTVYKITITDPAGCTINDTQEVWGFPGTDIFLPRAFIPASSNRDNSIFKPIYVGVTAIKYFKIYDRFGHEVFTTSDMSKFWDGTSNGVNQPMETYTWIIQGYDYNNKPIIRQGNVTLIRYQ